MAKYIIRQVDPESVDWEWAFDDDYLSGADDFNSTLFIIGLPHYVASYNEAEYKRIQEQAGNILYGFSDIGGAYNSYKDCMEDCGVPYSPRKCHLLKEWAERTYNDMPKDIAEFLTITTGEKWSVLAVRGYSQGDYAEVLFCDKYHRGSAKRFGELWLGCGSEFCVTTLDEDGEEEETVYGYFVADCEASTEDVKRLVCDWACIDEKDAVLKADYRIA